MKWIKKVKVVLGFSECILPGIVFFLLGGRASARPLKDRAEASSILDLTVFCQNKAEKIKILIFRRTLKCWRLVSLRRTFSLVVVFRI